MKRTSKMSQLHQLALEIVTAKLSTGDERDQECAQVSAVSGMIAEKVQVALQKLNSLKEVLEHDKSGSIYHADPDKRLAPLLQEVAQAGERLLEAERIVYHAYEEDHQAALRGEVRS